MQNEAQRKMDGKYSEVVRHRGYNEKTFHTLTWLPTRRDETEWNRNNICKYIQEFSKIDSEHQLQSPEAW